MKEYVVEQQDPMPAYKKKRDDIFVIVKKEDTDKVTVKAKRHVDKKRTINVIENVKLRRKRDPMTVKQCSLCPVKYRFVSKLQEHMKQEHGIDLFVCKVWINHLKFFAVFK